MQVLEMKSMIKGTFTRVIKV